MVCALSAWGINLELGMCRYCRWLCWENATTTGLKQRLTFLRCHTDRHAPGTCTRHNFFVFKCIILVFIELIEEMSLFYYGYCVIYNKILWAFWTTLVYGPYKCMGKQIWPCSKKVKCQHRTIILAILVNHLFPIICEKIRSQGLFGSGEDF